MKSFNFSALKLMTSLCLLLFVSLAATRLHAQAGTKHTTSYAVWEVADGNASFALYNLHAKGYLFFAEEYSGRDHIIIDPTSKFNYRMEKLSGGAYQVETGPNQSILCCDGSNNDVSVSEASTHKDDLLFEEVSKDVFRIKFKHNGTYLTVGGQGSKEVYGTTVKMGDHQLWMITGR